MTASRAHVYDAAATSATPQAGDWLEVESTADGPARRGVILEVLGAGSHIHFRVRWDEEHVVLFYPAERGYLVHRKAAEEA